MTNSRMTVVRFSLVTTIFLLLFACSSKESRYEKQLEHLHSQVRDELNLLENHLDSGRVRNALLIEKYATVVKKLNPDFTDIVKTLALEATTKGASYQALTSRLADAKEQIERAAEQGIGGVATLSDEFESIGIAANVANFNMMLTDPLNVLADMSDGKLPRVEAMAKEAAVKSNSAKDYGSGSQLIGNPNYGQWQQASNGTSFWAFYGQYAFFSSLFRGPVYYGDWARYRDYSYYHDVGRNYYSSPAQRSRMSATENRVRKNFSQKGKTFQSAYAKPKSSGSRFSGRKLVNTPSKFASASKPSSSKFSSPYGSSSQKSSFSSSKSQYSSRKSSSSSFRSFGGGGK